MFATQRFFVGVQDCGKGGLITNRALLEDMSDTANVHGLMIGQSVDRMVETHLAWVITHWKLHVLKRVSCASEIDVTTWSRAYNPAFAYRDFTAKSADGELIAKATSIWMILNTERNFPQRISRELMDIYQSETEQVNFPDYKPDTYLPDLSNAKTVPFTVLRSMIDYNNHVHNSSYLDIALEALPEQYDNTSFDNAEITYKKEIKPDMRLKLKYVQENAIHWVLIYDENEETLHTIIKLY